ncbi:hypothetical protein Ocin01_19630 [Orchesella cincta]|uniref:Uncharacterized protein n=1 Tax=Orchesella cincta TaxID=48709 RepID=A0A1D2M283_ORCCI|nr:hypothetical protein Ocin01_19630 [Orchesella cincta]
MGKFQIFKVVILTLCVVMDCYPTDLNRTPTQPYVFEKLTNFLKSRGPFFAFAEVPNMTSVESLLGTQIYLNSTVLSQRGSLTAAFGRMIRSPLMLIPLAVVITIIFVIILHEKDRPVPEHYHSTMRNQTLPESTCGSNSSPNKPPVQPLNNVLNNMTTAGKRKNGRSKRTNRLAQRGRDTIIRNNLLLAAQRRSGNVPEEDDFSSSDDEVEPIYPPLTHHNPLRPEYVLAALGSDVDDEEAQPFTGSKLEPIPEEDSEAV